MLEIAFLFLFFVSPFCMFYLLKIAGEKINKISIVNVTTVSIYIFSFLGTLPLFFMMDEYRVATGVTDRETVFLMLICSFVNMVFFLGGIIFIRKFLRLKPLPVVSSRISGLSVGQNFITLCFFAFVCLVLFVYIKKVGEIALFIAIEHGAAEAAIARSNMGNNLEGGGYHWYYLVLHNIGFLLTLNFYAIFLKNKNVINLFLFLISFLISSFVATMATEKAAFIGLLMALVMMHYLVKTDGLVPKKSLIFLGLAIISILVIFYIYFMESLTVLDAVASIISRAFSGSISPAYFYLQYFPNAQEFLVGRTFPNPGGFLPYTPVRYTVEVMNWVFPEMLSGQVVGSMPTVFWGEAYANFGFLGIPIIALIMGVVVALVSYLFSRIELNTMTVAFFVWLIFHFKTLATTGFSGFLYDFYLIFMLVVLFVVLLGRGKIKIYNHA